jgi:hypothetical protein
MENGENDSVIFTEIKKIHATAVAVTSSPQSLPDRHTMREAMNRVEQTPPGRLLVYTLLLAAACWAVPAGADDESVVIQLDLGSTWQSRNKVQIPNDNKGDKFSLEDVAGDGPWATVRAEGIWSINEKHGIRILLAPFSYSENGKLDKQTRFAGATYSPDQNVKASYTFNTYRVSYRYHLYAEPEWDFWVGGTLLVRDAGIKLEQGDVSSQDDNIGAAPLLYLAGVYRLDERWSISADLDGLAGGPGRALDLGIRLNYKLDDKWQVGLGYRTLEGGADTDDVYNFAWFNTASISASYRF